MTDLHRLAELVGQRNRVDRRIAGLIGRAATTGNIGEVVAAAIFDIELTGSGTTPGYDGVFRSGPYAGRTVNVKLYGEDASILAISPHPADTYLVLTGPRPTGKTNRALLLRVDAVYLFDSSQLLEELRTRGVQLSVATSVRKEQWEKARIYPQPPDAAWRLTPEQIELLQLFAPKAAVGAALVAAPVTVIGVDGARGGWASVELHSGQFVDGRVFKTFASLVGEFHDRAQVIAVDMPIGLTATGRRQADIEARDFIGPRRSSVFDAPPLWVLGAADYGAARAMRPAEARGVSAQTFALVKKIKEVDEARAAGARVWEVHPEVSFRAMKGSPLDWPKQSPEGRGERLDLLDAAGIMPSDAPVAGATLEDIIDACAAAWSAHRIATHTAIVFPTEAPVMWEPHGERIWF